MNREQWQKKRSNYTEVIERTLTAPDNAETPARKIQAGAVESDVSLSHDEAQRQALTPNFALPIGHERKDTGG